MKRRRPVVHLSQINSRRSNNCREQTHSLNSWAQIRLRISSPRQMPSALYSSLRPRVVSSRWHSSLWVACLELECKAWEAWAE